MKRKVREREEGSGVVRGGGATGGGRGRGVNGRMKAGDGEEEEEEEDVKMMELNGYTEEDVPAYKYDVHVQRLSVYVQRKEPVTAGAMGGMDYGDVRNPYDEVEYERERRWRRESQPVNTRDDGGGGRKDSVDENSQTPTDSQAKDHPKKRYIPRLNTLDNGNTIIVFEHCFSGSVDDTLVGARQEIESRWRRLTFYLAREDVATDEALAMECMELVLKDIFMGLAIGWEKYLACCATHVGILVRTTLFHRLTY